MILTWLDFALNLPPNSCEQLALIGSCFQQDQFRGIVDGLKTCSSSIRLRKFELSRAVIKPFPFPQIMNLLGFSRELEVIVIRSIEIDASVLLTSIFRSGRNLKSIIFSQMLF
jgi:hypothetical protein